MCACVHVDRYDYNASIEEPMFGLAQAAAHCRCLPRHMKHCPTPRPATSETDAMAVSSEESSGDSLAGDHMKLH